MPKHNVESFNMDHSLVVAPYVRLAGKKTGPNGDIVTKFDIRFTQPNKEFMPMPAIHTLEHLVAEYIRDVIENVIDFSPMGCRTGFYLTLFGDFTEQLIAEKMKIVLMYVSDWPDTKKVPGLDPKECGNYTDHNLNEAKKIAKNWVEGITKKGYAAIPQS